MYKSYLLVIIIPIFPKFLAITLSSRELNPNLLDCLTLLRHFAHLCTAYFVRPTNKGKIRIDVYPKIITKNKANK